ncbi:hypothetical protein ATY81_22475 [Rhizobium sp. R72]|nr:hypothetical protein ATY81_22475 [Rhizobium sp. R72]OWW02535.1 hypothetical protein ATY80_22475 [Rhizobium sp. R711]
MTNDETTADDVAAKAVVCSSKMFNPLLLSRQHDDNRAGLCDRRACDTAHSKIGEPCWNEGIRPLFCL